jgi:hypothetical protein
MTKRRPKLVREAEPAAESSAGQKAPDADASPQLRRRMIVAGTVIAVLASAAIYLLRLDRAAGFTVDDAWYILLAKSIATGQGYTVINSPTPGIVPFYPPGFPFLLSLIFRLAPHFPQNVWLLKAVSVVAMLALGALSYWYFAAFRRLTRLHSALGAFVVALSPSLVFLATSTVMSECVFALAQLLTLLTVERAVARRDDKKAFALMLAGAALAAATFLTRSMGIGFIAGAGLYLLKERRWRQAAIFAAGLAIFVGPWMLYSRAHAPTAEQRAEQGGYIVLDYREQFWMKEAGKPDSGVVGVEALPGRVWENFVKLVGEDVGRIIAPSFYRSPLIGGFELQGFNRNAGVFSLLVSAVILVGFVAAAREKVTLAEVACPLSLAVILLWPWAPLRLVLPSLPFLVFYFFRGCGVIARAAQAAREHPPVGVSRLPLALVGAALLAVYAYDHAVYIGAKFGISSERPPVWPMKFEEADRALTWMRDNLPADGSVVVSANPPLVYLRTGFKSVGTADFYQNWERWKKLNVRYLTNVAYPRPFAPPDTVEASFRRLYPTDAPAEANAAGNRRGRARLTLVDQLSGEWNMRVTDFGPPDSRRDLRAEARPAP